MIRLPALALAGLVAFAPLAHADWSEPDDIEQHDSHFMQVLYFASESLKAGDKQAAVKGFLEALDLEPDDETALLGVASASFDTGHYKDAAWAYEQLVDRPGVMQAGSYTRFAVSLMVLGDFDKAYDVLTAADEKAGGNSQYEGWRFVAAFAKGGWDFMWDQIARSPAFRREHEGQDFIALLDDIVLESSKNIVQRARTAHLKYALLQDLSVLFAIQDRSSSDRTIGHDAWNTIWEIVALYRSLPVKPVPPRKAVEAAQRGHDLAMQKKWYAAMTEFENARHWAPWWPELHYDLAMFVGDSNTAQNLWYDGEIFDNPAIRNQEMIFYVYLDPDGPYAKAACEKLESWGRACRKN